MAFSNIFHKNHIYIHLVSLSAIANWSQLNCAQLSHITQLKNNRSFPTPPPPPQPLPDNKRFGWEVPKILLKSLWTYETSKSTTTLLKSACSKSLTPEFVTMTNKVKIYGYQATIIRCQTFCVVRGDYVRPFWVSFGSLPLDYRDQREKWFGMSSCITRLLTINAEKD